MWLILLLILSISSPAYSAVYGDYESKRTSTTGGGSGSTENTFETISVPAGTNPVADSATDTLTITETSPLVITGTAASDTIDITWATLTADLGGTGATSLTDGGILLGSGTGAITPLGVATNGQIPIGDGVTDPVLATITGTADEITVTNGGGSITLDIPDPLIVGKGGSGAATFTDGGILLGSGTGAFTALGVATNGQIPIGDGTTDPVLATITGTANEVTVTNGAGTITLDLPLNAGTDITADLEEEVTEGSLADSTIVEADLKAVDAATDEECLTYESTTGDFEWEACGYREYVWPASATLPLQAADAIPPITKDAGTALDQLPVSFDSATDECRTVDFDVPFNVTAGGTVTFIVKWYSAATTTGSAMWDFRHNGGVAEGVDPDQTLTTISAASDAVQGTAGQITVTSWTSDTTTMGWVAGDEVYATFCRDGDGTAGTDNLANDALATRFYVRIPITHG